jgi:ABC-type transport system substrate-binding protein
MAPRRSSDLAHSWEITRMAEVPFHLRQGVQFHDGAG